MSLTVHRVQPAQGLVQRHGNRLAPFERERRPIGSLGTIDGDLGPASVCDIDGPGPVGHSGRRSDQCAFLAEDPKSLVRAIKDQNPSQGNVRNKDSAVTRVHAVGSGQIVRVFLAEELFPQRVDTADIILGVDRLDIFYFRSIRRQRPEKVVRLR